MQLATNRSATTEHVDFRADERARLVVWADKHGLAASIKPPGAENPDGIIFVGYGEGIAHWVIYRADGHLWLGRIEDQTERGREGSKIAVESVDDALARILLDTEA